MKVGLRIDVDTFRGTRFGVPNLCKLLDKQVIKATFFFCVGPDNMGRHLWRLLHPTFFWKMLQTKAASLYGWDILLKGTFGPGPIIGKKLNNVIRSASNAGHEIGLHEWDHYTWQTHLDSMSADAIHQSLNQGFELLTDILGRYPICSAVPSWKCNDQTLIEKDRFPFLYNSDCRGVSIFHPLVAGKQLPQPQIPVTLPTYDEVIGRHDIQLSNYNDYMLSLLNPGKLNILTIHAEVEGMVAVEMFDDFLTKAKAKGAEFTPLGNLLADSPEAFDSTIVRKNVPGRDGWVSCQATTEAEREGF